MNKIQIVVFSFVILFLLNVTSVNAAPGSSPSTAEHLEIGESYYTHLSAGEINYYHFEVPFLKSGAYNIYSTGTTDTKATLYEENGALWWITYDPITSSSNFGVGQNFYLGRTVDVDANDSPEYFSTTVDLTSSEDYYVKVSGQYTSTTGYYRTYVKEAYDYKYNYNGGQAAQVDRYFSEILSEEYYRTYLSSDAATMMWVLTQDEQDYYDVQQSYFMFGFDTAMSTLATAVGLFNPLAGILLFSAQMVISYMITFNTNPTTLHEHIEDKCNPHLVSVADPDGIGITATYASDNGMEIAKYMMLGYGEVITGDRFYAWTNNKLEGNPRERWVIYVND